MARKLTVESLVEELRSLAGVTSSVRSVLDDDEDVDWMVPSADVDAGARGLLRRLGAREQISEANQLDDSVKETIKGSLEVLAKRMEGIGDLVDMGKTGAVQMALEKVIKDSQTLLDSVSTDSKKTKEAEKREQDKNRQQQEPQSQGDQSSDKGQKGGSQGQGVARGGAQGRSRGAAPQANAAPTAAPQAASQPAQQEGVFLIGSDLITEAQIVDPFGLGEGFKADIARMSIPKRKRGEE